MVNPFLIMSDPFRQYLFLFLFLILTEIESEFILSTIYNPLVGKKSSNVKLSQKRADAVKGWLVGKGIDAKRITAKGYGPDQPRVANDTPENKRLNRRIEFKRTK